MEQKMSLSDSIEKWRRIAYEGAEDHGSRDCALCKLYLNDDCEGCPVSRRTGKKFCRGTPYEEWDLLAVRRVADTSRTRKIAEQEYIFLRSLAETDPHVAEAARRLGIPESEVTPEQRAKAKAQNYARMYGGQT